jgi:oligoendopeptidase F
MTAGEDGERSATVEAYLELLRSGGNDHPISQLQKAGVDFTTTKPAEALVAEMDSLVDRLEEELAKLDT